MKYSAKFEPFYNRLQKVHKHLGKIAKRRGITCYRVYDKDLGDFPLIIDKYEDDTVVFEYESKHKLSDEEYADWQDQCWAIIADVFQCDQHHIHYKLRRRKSNRKDQYQKLDDTADYKVVHENGLAFWVNLENYLDTGLFLDHRLMRQWCRENCTKLKVLNLFCYTAAFSIYAASGKADEVWSLDLSNTYLDWGKRNASLNEELPSKMNWIKCDVIGYLDKLPDAYFDLVIFDPPTFSNSKMMQSHWDVQAHHAHFLQRLYQKCTQGAKVVFSNNARNFVLDEQVATNWKVKDMTAQSCDFDFQGKLRRKCYLLEK